MDSRAPSSDLLGAQLATALGQELGLRGCQEHWFGVGLLWAFTNLAQGWTFYVPAGSAPAIIASRAHEKAREWNFGEAMKGADRVKQPAVGKRSRAARDEEPLGRGFSDQSNQPTYEDSQPSQSAQRDSGQVIA